MGTLVSPMRSTAVAMPAASRRAARCAVRCAVSIVAVNAPYDDEEERGKGGGCKTRVTPDENLMRMRVRQ